MRKLALILGIVCSITWLMPHISSAKIDPDTAAGVWLFDEGAGDTVKDSSDKGNDGEINGAKWKDGKFGDGLEFDGGDWVSIESTADLQLGDEHTMMAWFYATDISQHRMLISKNAEYLLRIDVPGEGNKMSTFVHIGGWEPRASAGVPKEDTWTHIAATFDSGANNNQLVIYVNGVQAGASTRPGKGTGNADPVTIGRWNNGSYFFGIIDEVAIFKDVLTEDDLKTIMDNGLDKALGGVAAVDASNKLTTTWANLKSDR
ncbi:LamG domain-containing protein [Candidatus Poribacteria bacterium]|nr:LamG domain-containing protein [Candidatus Poribacteria bacterium]